MSKHFGGLFKSLKGHHRDENGESSQSNRTGNEKASYQPGQGAGGYGPPAGPPPSDKGYHDYQPPPDLLSGDSVPAPYHDWTSIPDTALLPPPPAMNHDRSPTSNADLDDALRAHDWCYQNPLLQPRAPTQEHLAIVRDGSFGLQVPGEYKGSLKSVRQGVCVGQTKPRSKDSILLTSYPLYFAFAESPFRTGSSKTFYFEVMITKFGHGRGEDAPALSLGYCAIPYPPWRMPGWERGSLAVHSDDGHRYVADTEGGQEFTAPISAGDTVGIGMTFSVPDLPPQYGAPPSQGMPLQGEVFFTRNGAREGGWNLHEEMDAETEFGIFGLDGQFDLYGGIGTFGEVAFEAKFTASEWRYQP
jgi:hypothetical protein